MIVATGASARQLGLESEQALQGRGVSYCAVCDAAFFKDKDVVVVGGGDSAMEEAIFLTKFATKVTIVHRRDEFRASPIMLDRARANPKIEFVTNAVVDEVLGDDGKVTRRAHPRRRARARRARSPRRASSSRSATTRTRASSSTSSSTTRPGYLITQPGSTATNVPGVFAAGDVATTLPPGGHRGRLGLRWPRSTPSGSSRPRKATRRRRSRPRAPKPKPQRSSRPSRAVPSPHGGDGLDRPTRP